MDIGKKCIKLYHLNLYFNLKWEYKNCCYQKKEYYQKLESKNDLYHSSFISEVREFMEQGKEHPSCSHCYNFEKLWITSPREIYNKNYLDHNNIFPKKDIYLPTSLYFRFSNVCNFSCRMCSSYSSTSRKELDDALWFNSVGLVEFPNNVLELIKDKKFLQWLDTVDIKWWEPLLHKQHFFFLDYLIQSNFSKDIQLKYNSNLSTLPGENFSKDILPQGYESILDIWKLFKSVHIRVSLEGYGKDNEYIRIHSKWSDIENNISLLSSIPNIFLSLTSTIQIDNVLEIPKLVLFAVNKNISLNISSHSFVYSPEFLNVRILPQNIKDYIEKFYDAFLERYPNIPENYKTNLRDIVIYMNSGEYNKDLLLQYVSISDITNKLYKIKKSNIILEKIREFFENK